LVRSIIRVVGVVLSISWCWAAAAADLGTPIDLTSFGQELPNASASVSDDLPLREVARRFGRSPRRIYLSGMIGPSFANVSSPVDTSLSSDDTLFNAGGALGIAFERPRGLLRLELEGMGRDTYHAPFNDAPSAANDTVLTNNWSVMQNVWRDVMVTERFGVYGGGGIGAGGYILGEQLDSEVRYAPPGSSFAWQFGGGLLWNITDRLTFDVGYRYFTIDTIQQASYVWPNHFEASELMFSLRLYEPFRSWRR
jgi:opacity protein-like surface antigen